MADWTPITPGGRIVLGTVTVVQRANRTPQISIAADVLQGFGDALHVVALMNGSQALIGLRGTKRGPGIPSMQLLGKNSRGTAAAFVSAVGILAAAGKSSPERPTRVPHHWDGDVLVIDLSGLPDAQGGR